MAAQPAADRRVPTSSSPASAGLPCSPALLRAARAIAVSYARRTGAPLDELTAAANLGLAKALRVFNVERGNTLDAYVRLRIKAECVEWIRAELRAERGMERRAERLDPYEEHVFGVTPETHYVKVLSAWQELAPALGTLTDREREILRLLYVDGLETLEVGERLGLDPSGITKIHHSLLRRLRAYLERSRPAAEPETADAEFDRLVARLPEPAQQLLHMEQAGVPRVAIARVYAVSARSITTWCRDAWEQFNQLKQGDPNGRSDESQPAAVAGHR